MCNGTQWKLHDVKYVLDIKRDLISMSQIDIVEYIIVLCGGIHRWYSRSER